MKFDPGVNLIWISNPVSQSGIDLWPDEDRLLREDGHRVVLAGEVLHPHDHLPDIGTADQPGPAAGGPIAERDQRMLVTANTFFGVAAQAIRQRLSCRSRPQTQPLGQAVLQAN
jgi:hypothetical protein